MEIYVHSNALKHGLTEDEVANLFKFAWWETPRNEDGELLALATCKNRDYELIAKKFGVDEYLIFHCFTPPTKKFIKEAREKGLNRGY